MSLVTHQPTTYFPATPKSVRSSASGKTGRMSAGLVVMPKNKKKIAANRSLSGTSLALAVSATSPVSSSPIRNAATTPEKPIRSASPAASSAAPKTVSSSPPGSFGSKTLNNLPVPLKARRITNPVIASASPTVIKPLRADTPSTTEVRSGKYGASAKSSKTKTPIALLETSDFLKPISLISCAAIPEEET